MKRKIISLMLALSLVFSMSACGSTTENADTGETNTDTETDDTSDDQTQADAQADDAETESSEDNASSDDAKEDRTAFGSEIYDVGTFEDTTTFPESEALDFVQDMRLGWCLGNTFDAYDEREYSADNDLSYESSWCGYTTTEDYIQSIYDAGFNTLRLPVSWHNHVDSDYTISEAWLDRVAEVVDWAYERDMYVIINIHHDNNLNYMYPDYDHLDQSIDYVTTIWSQLAEKFADYDEKVIFEVMNEPRLVDTSNEWWIQTGTDLANETMDCINQINQAAVTTIRENGNGYNTSRYIMIPGYCASPDYALADEYQLPDDSLATADNRLLVSVHAYTPYSFALDKNGTDSFSIARNNGTSDIKNFMKKLYDKFTSKGIGVVIGEFGSMNKDNNVQAREEHAAFYIACARHYGMSACWWDNNAFTGDGENFGLLRRMVNTFLYPEIVDQMVFYSVPEDQWFE